MPNSLNLPNEYTEIFYFFFQKAKTQVIYGKSNLYLEKN